MFSCCCWTHFWCCDNTYLFCDHALVCCCDLVTVVLLWPHLLCCCDHCCVVVTSVVLFWPHEYCCDHLLLGRWDCSGCRKVIMTTLVASLSTWGCRAYKCTCEDLYFMLLWPQLLCCCDHTCVVVTALVATSTADLPLLAGAGLAPVRARTALSQPNISIQRGAEQRKHPSWRAIIKQDPPLVISRYWSSPIVTSMYCKTHIPNIRSALTTYECIKRHDYKQVFKHGLSTRDLSNDHLHLAVLKIFARNPANHLLFVYCRFCGQSRPICRWYQSWCQNGP